MSERKHPNNNKETGYVNPFADFVRNANSEEQEKVFRQVLVEAADDQRDLMERAEKLRAKKETNCSQLT